MGDFQLFFYIIIGVIYVFYRVYKIGKPKKPDVSPVTKNQQTSYKTTENKPYKATFDRPAIKSVSTSNQAKEQLLQALNQKRAALSVENVKIPVENYEDKPVGKPVDRLVDKNVEKKQEVVDPYATDQTTSSPYTQFLKTPEGIKAAFIASEIMQRKYD